MHLGVIANVRRKPVESVRVQRRKQRIHRRAAGLNRSSQALTGACVQPASPEDDLARCFETS